MTTRKKTRLSQHFVAEGRFYAMPLAFEGESFPIPSDESYLNAFAEAPSGEIFFGTTGGSKCHVFAGSAKRNCTGILDLGVVEDAVDIPVLLHFETPPRQKSLMEEIIFIANTGNSTDIYHHHVYFPFDSIQEPSFNSDPFIKKATLKNIRVEDAILTSDKKHLICLSSKGILDHEIETGGNINIYKGKPHRKVIRKFARINDSFAYFIDGEGRFCELNLDTRSVRETDVSGCSDAKSWGFCAFDEKILYANSAGDFFVFAPRKDSLKKIGKAILPNIQCMTVLPDKRIYGVAGSEIGLFFRLNIENGKSEGLGAIVSALGAKRYGFEFSKMLTGKDGEIYLCEKDRGGHLWIYFPRMKGN
ncbi:MAG: hypothetical protein JW808_09215 [Victivallales bacterium]|nr:hypothetical protein [Victivallales bacterium]